MENQSLVRLASTIYAENNNIVSRTIMINRIIEALLIERPEYLSIFEIIESCENIFFVNFTEDEIAAILSNQNYESILDNDNIHKFRLTDKRKAILLSRKKKNIDDCIVEFISLYQDISMADAKNNIYAYLYNLIEKDIKSYQLLLHPSRAFIKPLAFHDDSKVLRPEIVRQFIEWDNDDKNQCIFDVLCYSVEYCLLTNNAAGLGTPNLNKIQNKTFYLDANILYRILGINGRERQHLVTIFIEKCISCGNSFFISNFTRTEFFKSIEFEVKEFERCIPKSINTNLYNRFTYNENVIKFYLNWKGSRTNANISMFLSYLTAKYDEVKTKYNFVEKYDLIDMNDPSIKQKVFKCMQSIYRFKPYYTSENIDNENIEKMRDNPAYIDACNIVGIDEIRNNADRTLLDCQFFLASTDQQLLEWNEINVLTKHTIPIVMIPSRWLNILFRICGRSTDDTKCFVSFINIRTNDDSNTLSNGVICAILEGISEVTEDMTRQETYAQKIIEYTLANEPGIDPITAKTKASDFANREIEVEIKELSDKVSQMNASLVVINSKLNDATSMYGKASNELQIVQTQKLELEKKDLTSDEQIKALQKIIDDSHARERNEYVNGKLNNYKCKNALMAIFILAIYIIIFVLCFVPTNWNMVYQFIHFIESQESAILKTIFSGLIVTLVGASIIFSVKHIKKSLFSKDETNRMREKYGAEYNEKCKM